MHLGCVAEPVDAAGLLLGGVHVLYVLALVGHRSDALEIGHAGRPGDLGGQQCGPAAGEPTDEDEPMLFDVIGHGVEPYQPWTGPNPDATVTPHAVTPRRPPRRAPA
jgi:hypothetical protein